MYWHINYLHSESNQSLIELKQKFQNPSINNNIIDAGQKLKCKMKQVLIYLDYVGM